VVLSGDSHRLRSSWLHPEGGGKFSGTSIKTELPEGITYPDALRKLIDMEEKTQKFLLDAAKQSKSLVPDVSWIFERVGKKRNERIAKLRLILDKIAK